jgi:hypothetical protein
LRCLEWEQQLNFLNQRTMGLDLSSTSTENVLAKFSLLVNGSITVTMASVLRLCVYMVTTTVHEITFHSGSACLEHLFS